MTNDKSSGAQSTDLEITDKNVVGKELSDLLIPIGLGVFFSALAVVWLYVAQFGRNLPAKRDEWGQLGDYIGGLMNPLVGIATVVLVIISITIQRKELQASLGELKSANQATVRMSFEQSLFAWLSNYRELVQLVHADNQTGRNALTSLYESKLALDSVFAGLARSRREQESTGTVAAKVYAKGINWEDPDWLVELDRQVFRARESYQKMYYEHQTELDALPRTMFRLLQWIDRSPLSPAEKWHYAALVRAQLSWTELVFFFYNCYSKDGESFASVANRFALFDNLNPGKDVLVEHIRRQPARQVAAPLEPRAFSSKLAKVEMGICE